MSELSQEMEKKPAGADGPPAVDPFHNPSYPKRTHFNERGQLEGMLRSAEDGLTSARERLNALVNHPEQARFVRLYHQMQGARDQIAECVRRLPLEAGELYDLDKERYEQAVAALERIRRAWETTA